MSATLNIFDLVFIFSSLFVILIAFFRGFVREFFSLINWVVTILFLIFVAPFFSNIIDGYTSSKIVANVISSVLFFIVIFITSSIITKNMADSCKGKISFATDQILGIVYGFLKSLMLFGLFYAFIVNSHMAIYNVGSKSSLKKKMPEWLYSSKSRAVIAPFGNFLDPVVKGLTFEFEQRFFNGKKRKKYKKIEEIEEIKEIKEEIENPKEKGYSKKEIEKMDRLIEIVE
jgi:uncharacterized membrane protein required for colicin V production